MYPIVYRYVFGISNYFLKEHYPYGDVFPVGYELNFYIT
jgi:hypothetical protein